MKFIFEFDTESEDFSTCELEKYRQAPAMTYCISEIQEKVREWRKYDEREAIPVDEIADEINEIIMDNVNMEKMGY